MNGCCWTDDYGRRCGVTPLVAIYQFPLIEDDYRSVNGMDVGLCCRHYDKARFWRNPEATLVAIGVAATFPRQPIPEIPIVKPSLQNQTVWNPKPRMSIAAIKTAIFLGGVEIAGATWLWQLLR